jgi:beta-lactamase superfamily II metal-dependent hydrolase
VSSSRDNTSAARTCLVLLVIGAILFLIVLALIAGSFVLGDDDDDPTPTPTRQATANSADPLVFTIMDVGQGLCVVVITPDGHSMVIDGGRSKSRMAERVIPYLKEHGVERVDYVVATNPDQDHIGGLEQLLEDMPVGAWVDPVVPTTNQAYARELELVLEKGITPIRARRGMTLDLGQDVRAEILWPVDPLLLDGDEPSHNDNSIVLKLTYGETRFLVPGDIEEEAERLLVEMDTDRALRADVLVAAHHGSKTSNTAAFLDAVDPDVVLIGVGLDNQYGHPHDEVIQRLRSRGIEIYRTDLDGTVEVLSDGQDYIVNKLGTEDSP